MYDRFHHPDYPVNKGLYAYCIAPVAMLDMPVPVDARNALKEDGTVKVIKEYLTVYPRLSNDGSLACCLLNEGLSPRQTGVSEADLLFWDEHLAPYGLGTDAWLNIDEQNALMQTPEWQIGEV